MTWFDLGFNKRTSFFQATNGCLLDCRPEANAKLLLCLLTGERRQEGVRRNNKSILEDPSVWEGFVAALWSKYAGHQEPIALTDWPEGSSIWIATFHRKHARGTAL